jgi:hypothetical protein
MPVPPDWSEKLKKFVEEWKRNRSAELYVGDAPFVSFVLAELASCWGDLLAWLRELRGSWCFRGQREAAWSLLTSLNRAVRRNISSTHPDGITTTGYYHLDRETEQRELLLRFQQQAHLYIANLPLEGDLASWFALMQHHGAPTRFLDWTKSPYVGAYFAVEEEAELEERRSAIWAIDLDWLEVRGRELLQSSAHAAVSNDPRERVKWANSLLGQGVEAIIIKIDPARSSERMAAQQGIFLCKLLHEASFAQTLMTMMIHPETPNQPVVRKLELQATCRKEFLRNLRAMNIHRASLFPGIDGFARSLALDLEMKDSGET